MNRRATPEVRGVMVLVRRSLCGVGHGSIRDHRVIEGGKKNMYPESLPQPIVGVVGLASKASKPGGGER